MTATTSGGVRARVRTLAAPVAALRAGFEGVARDQAFTDEMVAQLSAIRHVDRIHTPLVIAVGSLETPEFQRQARDFAAALEKAGKPVRLIVATGYNHYEVGETFNNPYAVLGRACMDMMKLNGA